MENIFFLCYPSYRLLLTGYYYDDALSYFNRLSAYGVLLRITL
jgi:hypothetical protein